MAFASAFSAIGKSAVELNGVNVAELQTHMAAIYQVRCTTFRDFIRGRADAVMTVGNVGYGHVCACVCVCVCVCVRVCGVCMYVQGGNRDKMVACVILQVLKEKWLKDRSSNVCATVP